MHGVGTATTVTSARPGPSGGVYAWAIRGTPLVQLVIVYKRSGRAGIYRFRERLSYEWCQGCPGEGPTGPPEPQERPDGCGSVLFPAACGDPDTKSCEAQSYE